MSSQGGGPPRKRSPGSTNGSCTTARSTRIRTSASRPSDPPTTSPTSPPMKFGSGATPSWMPSPSFGVNSSFEDGAPSHPHNHHHPPRMPSPKSADPLHWETRPGLDRYQDDWNRRHLQDLHRTLFDRRRCLQDQHDEQAEHETDLTPPIAPPPPPTVPTAPAPTTGDQQRARSPSASSVAASLKRGGTDSPPPEWLLSGDLLLSDTDSDSPV